MKHPSMDKLGVDRRQLLALGAGGLGSLALNASPLSIARAFAASGTSALPNHYAAKVAPPDVPLDSSPGYLTFPKNLVKSVAEKPGKGGSVSGMTLWAAHSVPNPVDKNAGWQQLNQELDTELKVNLVQQSDYGTKWGTVTAGGDLPDMMYISIVPILPNVPAFVRATCTNLTDYLAGDAVKAYPNLANYDQNSWKVGLIAGELWGVPIVRPNGGFPVYVEQNILKTLGLEGQYPKSADDFTAFCKALTDPSKGRWAFGVTNDATTGPYSMLFFGAMFGAPNNWKLNSNGSMVKDIETDEYRAGLEYARKLIEAGYIAPDVRSNADLMTDLVGGKVVMRANSINGYASEYVERAGKVGKLFRILPPFGAKGGPGSHYLSPGSFGWVVLKKASPDRIKTILGVMNYLAAPFGSSEFMVTKFGKQGVDWDYNDKGAPILTELGQSDMSATPGNSWDRLAAPAPWLFSAEVPDFARFAVADTQMLLKVGVADPTWGQYSATDAKSGANLARLIFDRVSGIAAGRLPMSDFDQLVKDWKAQGGDQIRSEYERSIAG